MTIAEKVNRIDLTAIPKEYAAEIKLIKEETNNFTDEEVLEVYQDNLDILLLKINKRYPDAVKPKKKVILKKTEKKKVVKKSSKNEKGTASSVASAKEDKGCDEAVEELQKIRIRKKQAAEKRADAPKKQEGTLVSDKVADLFSYVVKHYFPEDLGEAKEFSKDITKLIGLYCDETSAERAASSMEEIVEKQFEKKTAAHGALLSQARKGVFSIDSLEGKKFKGYTFGEDWNGFAVPYFGFAEAQRIAKAIGGKSEVTFKKAYIDFSEQGSDEEETFPVEIIDTEDGEREVYAIGASGWTWWEDGVTMAAHGAKLNDPMEEFDLDDLDTYERRVYNDVVKASCKKIALGILIANSEGDYSQLSPKLAELAEQVEEETEEDN